jgi:hypothetical protein
MILPVGGADRGAAIGSELFGLMIFNNKPLLPPRHPWSRQGLIWFNLRAG